MNDINIFANADPKVIANIAFEFFGPNLGCSSVSKTTDAEVIAYSGATGKVRIDNDNFNNSVIGPVDDIEIYFPLDDSILGGTSPSSDLYIPVIPVYCDLAVTPINITYSNASSVNVVPHYKFIQPFILTVLSGGSIVKAHELYDTVGKERYLFTAKNLRTGHEVSGNASRRLFNVDNTGDSYIVAKDVVCAVASSTETCLLESTDCIQEGAIYIPLIDMLHIDLSAETPTSYLRIKYHCSPLTSMAATAQTRVTEDTFGNKVSGHQPLLLIPYAASYGNYDYGNEFAAVLETKSMAIDYVPRNAYGATLQNSYTGAESKLIYEDSTCELYVVRLDSSIAGRSNVTFGVVDKSDAASRVSLPMNCEKLFDIDINTTSASLEDFSVLSIDKLDEPSGAHGFNIKIALSDLSHGADLQEYTDGCGYILVNVYSNTLSNIQPAYDLAGSIASFRTTEVTIVNKFESRRPVALYDLDLLVSEAERPIPFVGDTSSDGGVPVPHSDECTIKIYMPSDNNATLPINSVSSKQDIYVGNSDYIFKSSSRISTVWDGKQFPHFTPSIVSDGHGELRIASSSHVMNSTMFPFVFPSVIAAKNDSFSRMLYLDWPTLKINDSVSDNLISPGTYISGSTLTWIEYLKRVTYTYGSAEVPIEGYMWFINLLEKAPLFHNTIHGFGGGELKADDTTKLYLSDFTNAYKTGRTLYIEPYVGTLCFLSTPIIGDGNVPTTSSFVRAELGLDIGISKLLSAEKSLTFGGKKLLYAPYDVYENSSVYRHSTDLATRYSLLPNSNVTGIYAVTNYLFADLDGACSIYSEYNNTISKIITLPGSLCISPCQEGSSMYFILSFNGKCVIYSIMQESVLPVYEIEADEAILASSQTIGLLAYFLDGTTLYVYSILLGSVVRRYSNASVESLNTYSNSGQVSVILKLNDGLGYEVGNDTAITDFTIESSEFHFPYIEGERMMLFGIKILFDIPESDYRAHETFTIDIDVNDRSYYYAESQQAQCETVIRFKAMPVGSARYSIRDCVTPVRGVKWLIYRAPFINESVTHATILVVLSVQAFAVGASEYVAVRMTGITVDYNNSPTFGTTFAAATPMLTRTYEIDEDVTITAPEVSSTDAHFTQWEDAAGTVLSTNRVLSLTALAEDMTIVAKYTETMVIAR